MREQVMEAFAALEQYCKSEGFKGWDPYDGLMSKFFQAMPILPKNRFTRLVWIQLMKKSPLNFRRILKVEKDFNAKGVALFLSGYSRLHGMEKYKNHVEDNLVFLADKLISLRTPGYAGSCWGYNFDWESRAFFQQKNTPTIVATTYAANALIDAYEATKNERYLEAAVSSKSFILKDLKRTYDQDKNFAFSYSPNDQTTVFNASLLGARLLSRIYSFTKEPTLAEEARKTVAYCCRHQNEDGSWFYSNLPFHQWIDNFHTGFNLECITAYEWHTGDSSFQTYFQKGMKYYLTTFFDGEGRSAYYNNALYPIDIHAPSQLVITLSKASLFKENIDLIDRVLKWTIENMQSPAGYFYFQKRKHYTNKIPYMRWSQGWIFYALAEYIKETETFSPKPR